MALTEPRTPKSPLPPKKIYKKINNQKTEKIRKKQLSKIDFLGILHKMYLSVTLLYNIFFYYF